MNMNYKYMFVLVSFYVSMLDYRQNKIFSPNPVILYEINNNSKKHHVAKFT